MENNQVTKPQEQQPLSQKPESNQPKQSKPNQKKQPQVEAKSKTIKRVIAGIAVAAVVCVGGWFLYTSSNVETSVFDIAKANIGEARHHMKATRQGGLEVQFYTGVREETYVKNGIATRPVPFAIVNVIAGEELRGFPQIDGKIKIGEREFDITLLQNPYNPLNYSYDVIKIVGNDTKRTDDVSVTLFVSSTNHPVINLQHTMTDECVTWDVALLRATEKLGKELAGKRFETYITIQHDVAKGSGAFWYIQFVTDEGKTLFCVVSSDGAVI